MGGLSGGQVLQATVSGKGGAVALGEKATAVGERALYIDGNVYGSISTGGAYQQLSSIQFALQVLNPENNNEPVTQLEPSKQYKVVVWSEGYISISAHSNLSLLLQVQETATAQYITIENPEIDLSAVQDQDSDLEFNLITDAQLPHGQATLTLQCWPSYKKYRKKTVFSQQIHLAGLVDPELFSTCNIHPNAERPQHVAIIHVKFAEDNERIQLTCWGHCANRDISTMPFLPPSIRLADFVEAQTDPWVVLGEMIAFSDETANIKLMHQSSSLTILGWLKTLYNRHKEALQLTIVDHTDTEIPWEMLKLSSGNYLGTLVPVVRWLLLPQGDTHRELELSPSQRIGKVAAYLDEVSLPDATSEKALLSNFDTHFHDDIRTLETNLRELQPDVGLVYLGCHGMFVPHDPKDRDGIAFGSQNNPSERLIPLDLEAKLADKSFSHQPVFFINACHSGRIIKPKYRLGFRGLPIVLLKRIAASYVGTLGPVGSEFASQIGRYVLEAIHNSQNGESLAELLRQLRKMATEQLTADMDSTINQLRFIYTFMYVYYGNPLLKLSLHSAPEPEGESDV